MFLLILFTVLGVAAVAAAAVVPSEPMPPDASRLAEVERRTRRWRVLGLLVGLLLSGVMASSGGLGRGLLLAVPVGALATLLGVAVGELRVTAPSAPVRRASLEARRRSDYLPRALTTTVVVVSATAAGLVTWTSAVGNADDLGRAGRAFVRQCSAIMMESSAPWPGSFYALPLVTVGVAGIAVSLWALRLVVRRPRQGEDPSIDDALRRRATRAVVAALGVLMALPTAGVALLAAMAVAGSTCPRAWDLPVAISLGALAPVLLGVAGWCAVVLVVPSRGARRREGQGAPS